MAGWLDAWMHGCMDAWMHGCMDAWMHACMHAWMDGWMDGWMEVMNITQCGGGGENSCLLHRRVASALIILGAFLLCGV